MLHRRWHRAVEALFPTSCLLCGRTDGMPDSARTGVCGTCRGGLQRLRAPVCDRCGMELISERSLCTRCRTLDFAFGRNRALYAYRGGVRDLLHQYKLAGHRRIASLFAEGLFEVWRGFYDGVPLVPVPGRASTWRKRGWEHVDELARRLERLFGVPVARCLRRRSGSAQKALDYEARLQNIRGAVTACARRVPDEAVLLDDVMTTGATLHECARVLRASGCRSVQALTVAVDE